MCEREQVRSGGMVEDGGCHGEALHRRRGRTAQVGSAAAALVFVTLTGAVAGAAPDEGDGEAMLLATDAASARSSVLPNLPAPRLPALQLLWFDTTHTFSAPATDVLATEVRRIFRALGVDVAFRVAAPDSTYGDGPVPEIPIILLKDDPIALRRPSRVMGLVVRNQEPNRVVWAFLENVRWTLREGRDRELPAAGLDRDLGLALARVVAHEVIHAIAPDEPHSRNGLMSHAMNRTFLLSEKAPLDRRCARAFLTGLAARKPRVPKDVLASVR